MSVDLDLIRHLEELARIELTDDERELLAGQLARIVEFVGTIQSVDTTGVDAAGHMTHLDEEHLRDDEPRPGLAHDDVMAQAPDSTGGYFRVPPVIVRDEST